MVNRKITKVSFITHEGHILDKKFKYIIELNEMSRHIRHS